VIAQRDTEVVVALMNDIKINEPIPDLNERNLVAGAPHGEFPEYHFCRPHQPYRTSVFELNFYTAVVLGRQTGTIHNRHIENRPLFALASSLVDPRISVDVAESYDSRPGILRKKRACQANQETYHNQS
jgi:hypothetical protein